VEVTHTRLLQVELSRIVGRLRHPRRPHDRVMHPISERTGEEPLRKVQCPASTLVDMPVMAGLAKMEHVQRAQAHLTARLSLATIAYGVSHATPAVDMGLGD
jgi:hypothetical protein